MKKASRPNQTSQAVTSYGDDTTTQARDERPSNGELNFARRWDTFWFRPRAQVDLLWLERGVWIVTYVWLLTIALGHSDWWSDTGWHAADFNRRLAVATDGILASRFRVSLLWISSSYWLIRAWCVVTMLLVTLCWSHAGGRVTRIALWIACLWLAQRLTWSTAAVEPFLLAVLGYFCFSAPSRTLHWSHQFTWRTVQVHAWLMLVAALAAQLSLASWWQGEAVWWMASTDRSTLLSTSLLSERILLVNLLSHVLTIATVVSVVALWPLATSPSVLRIRIGTTAACVLAAGYALLGDQILYGCLIAVVLVGLRIREPNTESQRTQSKDP